MINEITSTTIAVTTDRAKMGNDRVEARAILQIRVKVEVNPKIAWRGTRLELETISSWTRTGKNNKANKTLENAYAATSGLHHGLGQLSNWRWSGDDGDAFDGY